MTTNLKQLKNINIAAIDKLSEAELTNLPEITNSDEMLKRKELRSVFEEVFKSLGPFECNETIDRAYTDPVKMAMYVAFVQSLREMRLKLLSVTSSLKKATAIKPPFIIARNDEGGTVTSSGKPKIYEHQATACSEAIKLVNRFGSSFSVYGTVNTYAPREKPVREDVIKRETKTSNINPITVINRLYAYLNATEDKDRPENTPVQIDTTPTGAVVRLQSGDSVTYGKPLNAYRSINDFLLIHMKQTKPLNQKNSTLVPGAKQKDNPQQRPVKKLAAV